MTQNVFLDRGFYRVRKLESVAAEELDSVVAPWIVRGRNHHAGVKAVGSRQKRHCWSGHHSALSTARPVSRSAAASVAAIHGLDSRVSRPRITLGWR